MHLSRNKSPVRSYEARQEIIDSLDAWKLVLYPADPALAKAWQGVMGKPWELAAFIELTNAIMAWWDRNLDVQQIDVTPLDEVRRILARRAAGETTPDEELRAAGERAARACDRIRDLLHTVTTRAGVDLVLITVNKHETQAVHDLFREVTGTAGIPVPLEGRLYHNLGTLNHTTVYHAISEMGSSGPGAMQQAVDKAIRALDPGAVIAVGIAFGVNEKGQSIGDILLSKQLRLYELQRMGAEIVPRGDKPHASSQLINHFEGFSQVKWKGAKVRPGVILSGEKLIDTIDYRDQLLKFEVEAVGGEMEGTGLYVSSLDHKVDWIVIKAICDWADGSKKKNKTQRQKRAAKNAAEFVVESLKYAPLKRK